MNEQFNTQELRFLKFPQMIQIGTNLVSAEIIVTPLEDYGSYFETHWDKT